MKQVLLTTAALLSCALLSAAKESTPATSLYFSRSDQSQASSETINLKISHFNNNTKLPYVTSLSDSIFESSISQTALIVSYTVPSKDDTLCFTFTKNDPETVEYREFQVIAVKGAAAPGVVVTDTLTLDPFFFTPAAEKTARKSSETLQAITPFDVILESSKVDKKHGGAITIANFRFLGEKSIRVESRSEDQAKSGSDTSRKFAGTVVSNFNKKGMSLTVPLDGDYDVSLMGANGRVLEKRNVPLTADTVEEFGMNLASTGVFFVQVEGNGVYVTEKIVLK